MYSMKSLTFVNLRNLVTELNRSLSATAALMVSNDLSLCMNRGSESNLHRQRERQNVVNESVTAWFRIVI